jgi:UDP-4-amino-4,6-dideoxy-N-acetyl-beta-L-altrosamine transaminase
MKPTLPAIAGGQPVRREMLPYARQWIDEDDITAVTEVLRGEFLTTGPKIREFEEKFARYVGARYAVAVANGTAALHAAVFAAGVGPGDEVITTPMTFAASANCVLYQGGQVVFADIRPEDGNIDPAEILAKLTGRTKAVIPVHFAGRPADLREIHALAGKHGLVVIEDAAHALGASYHGKKIGGLSQLTIFSFHPVKHITTGEGGMITTNDSELYKKLVMFRNHGITRDRRELTEDAGPWYYEMQVLGYNYRLTDLQAALGIRQLAKCRDFIALRRKYAGLYNGAFQDLAEVITPVEPPGLESAWHLYVLQLRTEKLTVGRKKIFAALRAENIGVNVHYIPVYRHPYYRELGYNQGLCPKSEQLYERIITLPLFPGMTEQDVEDVIRAVKKVIGYYRIKNRNGGTTS